MTNRNFNTPLVTSEWANSRETAMPVAVAIHAISDSKRSADAIWDAPTPTEWDHVTMAVEEYVTHGDFKYDPYGYSWGMGLLNLRWRSEEQLRGETNGQTKG